MDQPRPTVEKVPSRRSLPLVVGLVAVAFTALLVWQPWQDRKPGPTSPLVAAEPPSPTATLVPTASPDPTASPRPLPTPDLGPIAAAGDFEMTPPPGSALVQCRYSRLADGRRYFRGLEVQPPRVTAFNDEEGALDIRSVSWRVEIQLNRLDTVFDRDWATVASSRRQVALPAPGSPTVLFPLYVEYNVPRDDSASVLRALVIVEWHTRNLELAGRVEEAANSYQEANDPQSEIQSEGCRGVREPGPGPTVPEPGSQEPVHISLVSPPRTPVVCDYSPRLSPDGHLTGIRVRAPRVDIGPANVPLIRYLAWWFVVERGFDPTPLTAADELQWVTVYEAAPQVADAGRTRADWSTAAMTLDTRPDSPEVRYRVTVVVEWYDRATTLLRGAEIPVRLYGAWPDGFSNVAGCMSSNVVRL